MPGWSDVGNIWKNLREVDLRPIRAQAERIPRIAVVGEGSARSALIAAISEQPPRPTIGEVGGQPVPGLLSLSLSDASNLLDADLIVLVQGEAPGEREREHELFEGWRAAGKSLLVIHKKAISPQEPDGFVWNGARLIGGSTSDPTFVREQFIPAVLTLLPDQKLSLARYFPVFRLQVVKQLVGETSMANATYALSTGLAEIVPILDVPFNIADMIILTKAQAIMAYKLGLALGLSGNWQDHMAAFGSTVGSGFVWRQIARQLVGLIPVWGIIPKVAVAYAGTYVLGQAILQWYLTGRQVTPAMMRQLYRDAFEQGKKTARSLLRFKPRPARRLRLTASGTKTCANCGAGNPAAFNYCGRCGTPFKT